MGAQLTPRLLTTPQEAEAALTLIRGAFAYMDGRIDPPSSMHRLCADAMLENGGLWGIGTPLRACVVLTPMNDALYIGKLAVADAARGQGLARAMIMLAAQEAQRLNLAWLELETRIELTENHAVFGALGFRKVGETAHPGYDRPTSITMRKAV